MRQSGLAWPASWASRHEYTLWRMYVRAIGVYRLGHGSTQRSIIDHPAAEGNHRTDRGWSLERRGRHRTRDLAENGEGTLRHAAAEARRAAEAADSAGVSDAHGRRPSGGAPEVG